VLAAETAGGIVRWKRPDECWERSGDPDDFRSYVATSLASFNQPADTVR
jgi:hypothetical protein